ncbi:MAG: membrane protein insertase YidC [Treponema sp.]|nr:membrane protein insertase YidC [Treponema sp.]
MEKNTAWAIGLSSVVLIGFFFLQTYLYPVKNEPTSNTANTEIVASNENTTELENKKENLSILEIDNSANLKEESYIIETEKVKVTFTNRGGDIIGYEIKNHEDSNTKKFIEMADNVSEKNRAFSISLGNANSNVLNDIFNVKKIDENTIGFYKNYIIKNSDGTNGEFTLVKKYTLNPNDYVFKLDITIDGGENFKGININDSSYSIRTSPQIGPFYNPKIDKYENRQFISFNGEKKKKIILGNNQFKSYDKAWKWTSIAGKYFEVLTYPKNSESMSEVVYYSTKSDIEGKTNAQAIMTRKACDTSINDTYYIYVGPRNEKELKIYNVSENNEWGLSGVRFDESLQTSGILNWLEIVLKFLLEMINKFTKNWGISIIILTAILKFALFPLTAKTAKGTVKMQELQPKLQAIQEKYRDNPQKLNEQTAKLYREIGYNPMSGCLPMIFQFVILFAMYNLFNNYFEFRGAEFIPGWIPDLSSGDSVKTLNFSLPFIGNQIRLLPLIYLISQLLYGKITQNGGTSVGQNNGQMKFMMYGMPILFFFLFYNAPSGLLLYWTVSNIIQLAQQLFINKTIKKN